MHSYPSIARRRHRGEVLTGLALPVRLWPWWRWGQVLGWAFPLACAVTHITSPMVWAMAIHFFVDFTCQSDATAAGKARGDLRVLTYHSLIAGGFPGLIVGGLWGLAFSVVIHFLVDYTRKFGREDWVGIALDQGAHLLTILIIAMIQTLHLG